MSERDSVHKEIEKLQEELGDTKKKAKTSKACEEEVKWGYNKVEVSVNILSFQRHKLQREVEFLKRVIEQSLFDRDKAVKEVHDLRWDNIFSAFKCV